MTTTPTQQLTDQLTRLRDLRQPLDQLATKTIHIGDHTNSGHTTAASAPLPINLGAFQLVQDIDAYTRRLVHLLHLHPTRDMDGHDLIKGALANRTRLDMLDSDTLTALAGGARDLVGRARLLLYPPEGTRMVGWCPRCVRELRCDEQEIAGGWVPCPGCGGTWRIKDLHTLAMQRLHARGVKGTPAQLSRLLKPWGIDIKAATIRQWVRRGVITPVTRDGGAPVILVWDVWAAHTRLAGYERARRRRT
ncbi:hypothetical protein [Bifidobacterium stellenboschense]|uniref:PhnA protein n=1 Tax=Bifidobacterium stellenboschense TaxID=762211 RepID=A0A087DQM9_9BIFI|nr:hypothetical protein [Bifidobacterium stellenboschense]KFI97829.1 hypothetical protein BSTEL_0640 [Bifidobacterium stellenboschense]